MPWVPSTDFEEEVVNLQPHHDFIYGALSEPQYSYPRPKSHTEYAAKKKVEEKQQQKEYETTGNMNEKLRLIQQVQHMARTKPVGEQPSVHDWDDNKTIEQETVGMMRYCGMGVSVEKPLNEKITIASYPVQNSIQVVKSGRKKVALFFDDNVFKLKEKVSDTSSGFESCNNSESFKFHNGQNDSIASELDSETSSNCFNTTSDTFSSASSGLKSPSKHYNRQRLPQYEKLLDDISLLSLDTCKTHSSNNSTKETSESFKTAKDGSSWTPVFEDEDIFSKKENWPVLSKNNSACDVNSFDNSEIFNKTQSDSSDDMYVSSNSSENVKRENFLKRFIKSEDIDTENSTESTTSPPVPTTYATVAKVQPQSPKQKQKKSSNANNFPPFYTTKKMYALKRNVK